MKTYILLIGFLLLVSFRAEAIERDTTRKNIIRWNITPMMIVGPKSIVLGYERVLKNNQSFSINLGYLEKQAFEDVEGNPIQIADQVSRGGVDITADYRFYMRKRNKWPAPDGLYLGTYLAYYSIWHDASLNLIENNSIKNTVFYNANLSLYSVGLQLGYQFVFKKHITIDLILLGPSYTYYDINMGLNFRYNIDPDDPFYQDLMDFVEGNDSFLSQFIKNQSFDANGRLKFSYYGFRYGVQLGYNF